MDYHRLKNADMTIPRLSLGTWAFSGSKVWGPNEEADSIRTISLAMDSGITLIDTATAYGDGKSEEVLGKAIKGKRADVLIATKVFGGNLEYDYVLAECEKSLTRLGTDYVDIYQIHWPSKTVPFDETMRAFEKLKQDGKVRAIGVCNHGPVALDGVKDHAVVLNQLPYSLIWRQIEDGVVAESEKYGIGVWAYSPLAQGILSGKFKTIEDVPMNRRMTRFYSSTWGQARHGEPGFEKEVFGFLPKLQAVAERTGFTMTALSFAFLKASRNLASILVGARNETQLKQNIAAYEAKIPADVVAEVTKMSDALKPRMGTCPDLWEGAASKRIF